MTRLSEALRDFQTGHWRMGIQPPSLPTVPPKLEKACAQVIQILGLPSTDIPLPENESERWRKEALRRFEEDDWDGVNPAELKKIARCLWDGEEKLGEVEKFMQAFLDACAVKVKRSLGLMLISLYLRYYSPDGAGIRILGKWLKDRVTDWAWGQVWRERQDAFSIFSPGSPDVIAEAVLTSKQSPLDCLASMGISGNLLSMGLSLAAFNAGCRRVRGAASPDASLLIKKILDWAIVGDGKFAFQKSKVIFIESLLAPWSEKIPNESVKNRIQGFLLDQFGDPRLPHNGHNWIIREDAKRVILRWLVKRSLDQFLDVVDNLALDHQWKYRRAFWTAYYKRDVISDAWVAFAAAGEAEVKRIARRIGDDSWLSIGKLTGSGDSNHAVLILRIGDLIIADFSHNGKCRIWKARGASAPKPYQHEYARLDLMNSSADWDFVHHSSDHYHWQAEVADKIRQQAGCSLSQRDYMA